MSHTLAQLNEVFHSGRTQIQRSRFDLDIFEFLSQLSLLSLQLGSRSAYQNEMEAFLGKLFSKRGSDSACRASDHSPRVLSIPLLEIAARAQHVLVDSGNERESRSDSEFVSGVRGEAEDEVVLREAVFEFFHNY